MLFRSNLSHLRSRETEQSPSSQSAETYNSTQRMWIDGAIQGSLEWEGGSKAAARRTSTRSEWRALYWAARNGNAVATTLPI